MELSSYQKDILDFFVKNPHHNIIVQALAGTGKSTLLKMLTDKSSTSDIYVAFNTSIANEFRGKITNPKTKISTLHALAYSFMNFNLKENGNKGTSSQIGFGKCNRETESNSESKANLDNLKCYKIVDMLIDNMGRIDFERKLFLRENYVHLYNLSRLTMLDLKDIEALKRLVKNYNLFVDYSGNGFNIPPYQDIQNYLVRIDKESLKEFEKNGKIDFTDMLYITFLKLKNKEWKVPYWGFYTNVLVDEAQDLSSLQLFFLKFIRRNNGRYVFVMDKNQAIYSFAGGNALASSLIPKIYAPAKEFSLPINYRCPYSHLNRVNKLFKIPIQPRPDAPRGIIKTIEKEDIVKYVKSGDMVISRKNKWLTDVILHFVKSNIPIYMEDKEMVDSVKKMITKNKNATLINFRKKLLRIVSKCNEELVDTQSYSAEESSTTQLMSTIISTNKKIDDINFVLEILNYYIKNPIHGSSMDGFSRYVDNLLNTSAPKNCVRLCSVHKAKGLEARSVFVLNEARVCYSPTNSKEQNEQEYNLSYISLTRAFQNLYLVKERDEEIKKQGSDFDDSEDEEWTDLPNLNESTKKFKEVCYNA